MQISELDIRTEIKPFVEMGVHMVEEVSKKGLKGIDKKTAAIAIVKALYKVADARFNFPDMVDSVANSLIPIMIDQTVNLFNNSGIFSKKQL
jgi:hypothetical protein